MADSICPNCGAAKGHMHNCPTVTTTPNLAILGGANGFQVGGEHYRSEIQHWDYVLANKIPYLEAVAIKYLTRWRKKDGHKDLRKAQHFLRKLFESEGLAWDEYEKEAGADSRYVDQDRSGKKMAGAEIPTSQGPFAYRG